jgi:tRNA dimethylallyltransferase
MNSVIVIAGATASGKSKLALDIAKDAGGVIINADAMQVYADISILSARPSEEDLRAAPHRLYGILSGDESCSAARWSTLAAAEIQAVWAAGQLPIVVGGTGLYLSALMDGLSPIPNVSPEIRAAIDARCDALGAPALHAELLVKDPVMGKALRPSDRQRVIRALSVIEATGKSLSHFQALPREKPLPDAQFEVKILDVPRADLYRRCDDRFVKMVEQGAVEEVRKLVESDRCQVAEDKSDEEKKLLVTSHLPLAKIIGVRELAAYIAGKTTLEEAIIKAQQMTRNYAKRQMTWFRNQL